MQKKIAPVTTNTFLAIAVVLPLLTGCVEHGEPRYHRESQRPAMQVIIVDDYDYFPGYGIYYSRSSHEYVYLDGSRWVRRSSPRGVTAKVLFTTPMVKMDFHDSPEHHHESVVRSYPKDWGKPDKARHDKKDHPGKGHGHDDRQD